MQLQVSVQDGTVWMGDGELIVGEQSGGFANIDFALDDAVAGFFGETAKHQPAPVDHFALGGGHGEELEARIIAPEIEEGVETGSFEVLTAPSNLIAVRAAIEGAGISVHSAEIVWGPSQHIEATPEVHAQVEKLVDLLEDLDDVQRVFTNLA